jgi:hypothetical protein
MCLFQKKVSKKMARMSFPVPNSTKISLKSPQIALLDQSSQQRKFNCLSGNLMAVIFKKTLCRLLA